jgi:asparagine synthase (glutamine-hydrolysing)
VARHDRLVGLVPASLRAGALGWAERTAPNRAGRARIALRSVAGATELDRLESWFAPFTAAERQRLLQGVESRRLPTPRLAGDDAIERMLAYDCAGWLADNLLERGDRMAMAASVELRPPFLDHHLVSLAYSVPSDLKVRHGQTKWILKEVARRHLPTTITDRRKVGFRVPLDTWFRGHLRELARDQLLASDSFVGNTLDRQAVAELLDSHEAGRRDESIRIWTLLSLEVWHQTFFRQPA